MGFKCGILGLSNVGKSTVFNALTATAAAQASNYPFSTIEPNVGEVMVPDPRLDVLAKLAKSAKIKPTRLTFVDIAGLVSGASKGEGLGNQFLAHVREVDAIAHVVRCFVDPDIAHVAGAIDPIADIDTIETELMLADLDSLERRVEGLAKKAKGSDKDANEARETLDLVERALALLRDGKPARLVERKPEEEQAFRMLGLLTSIPVLYVCNVDEASAATGNEFSRRVEARAKEEGAACVIISAKIEAEIAVLPRARARRISRRDRARGAGPRPTDPRRLRAAQSDHLFHRRPQGGGGLDHHARDQGAAGGGRHPFRLRARLHPRRDHRLRRLCGARRRDRRATSGQDAARGQELRGRRRRRHAFQVCDVAHLIRHWVVIAGFDTASRGYLDLRPSILRNSGKPELRCNPSYFVKSFVAKSMDPRVKPAGDAGGCCIGPS